MYLNIHPLDIYDKWIWTNEVDWDSTIPRNLKLLSFKLLYYKNGYIDCIDGVITNTKNNSN